MGRAQARCAGAKPINAGRNSDGFRYRARFARPVGSTILRPAASPAFRVFPIRMSNSQGCPFSRRMMRPRCEQFSPRDMRGGSAPAGAGCGGWSTIRIAANRGACGRATAAIFDPCAVLPDAGDGTSPSIPASYRRSPAPRAAAKRRSPVVGPDGDTQGLPSAGDTSSPARRRRILSR